MATKKQTPKVVTIQTTGRGSRAQVILHDSTCKLCGMPLITPSAYPLAQDATKRQETIERGVAGAVAGCAFCAPDGVYGVAENDAALLVFTEAFNLTERVLQVRAKLATLSSMNRWTPRQEAWSAVAAKYPKVAKVESAKVNDSVTLADLDF